MGRELSFQEIVQNGLPSRKVSSEVNEWRASNAANIWRAVRKQGRARRLARKHGLPYLWSQLWLAKIDSSGRRIEYGLAGLRVVTTAGVGFIVDAFQNSVELESMRYHGVGTDNTAENASDTALGSELTTQYGTDNTRATGTLAEGASANIYKTVGLNTVDASVSAVEHGIFSQAATSGGVLLDRTVFSTVSLSSGDSLESTYELTINSGS